MATKPTSLPVWATDADTTLEPSAGQKAAGFTIATRPPARWMNWLLNTIYGWCAYLSDGLFTATGSSDAVTGTAVDGHGVVAGADTTSPAKSALRLVPQDVDPSSSPALGDIYVHATDGKINAKGGGGFERYVPQVFASIVDSNEVKSTDVETDFNQTYTFAANSLRAGAVIRVRAVLSYDYTSSPTVNFRLYMGSTEVFDLAIACFSNGGKVWIDFVIVVQELGASAAGFAYGVYYDGALYADARSAVLEGGSSGVIALNTTASQVLKMSADWSAASADNIACLKALIVDVS